MAKELQPKLHTEAEKLSLPAEQIMELCKNDVEDAISVAWDMLTLVPPAILCTPEKYLGRWHDVNGKQCVKRGYYKLSYYRPLMLYDAHGSTAVRAIVGKEASSEPTLNIESDSEEGI